MRLIKYFFNLIFCLGAIGIIAQDLTPEQLNKLEVIAYPTDDLDWITFRKDIKTAPSQLFEVHYEAFGLTHYDEMVLMNENADRLGMTHYRYRQYYQGFPIQGAEFIVHTKNGRLNTANGKLARNLSINYQKGKDRIISEALALKAALQYAGGKHIIPSGIDEHERSLALKSHDNFTPAGALVWSLKKGTSEFSSENLVLAWRFDIYVDAGESRRVFIHANTEKLVEYYPLTAHNCISGESQVSQSLANSSNLTITANNTCDSGEGKATWVEGKVTIFTSKLPDKYILKNDCFGFDIHLRNMNDSTHTTGATEFVDETNLWDAAVDKSAIQTFWGVYKTVQKFSNTFGRNSWDDKGANINLYNNAQFIDEGETHPNNASALNGELKFGRGNSANDPDDDWNTLDIVAHEFTHDVTRTSAELKYKGESGALNEAFSDIFGEIVEEYAYTGRTDWLQGAKRGAIRSLKNPNDFKDPDTYKGKHWKDTNDTDSDHGGVHTNSGVLNYCFYLLSEGGSGKNDKNHHYNVNGIGIREAEQIAYRALTGGYLTSTSNYRDARRAFVQAAKDLYGSCSEQVVQVIKAFHAVGVGEIPHAINIYDVTLRPSDGIILENNQEIQAINSIQVERANGNRGLINGRGVLKAGRQIIIQGGAVETVMKPKYLSNWSRVLAYADDCSEILPKSRLAGNTNGEEQSRRRETNDIMSLRQDAKETNLSAAFTIMPNPTTTISTLQFHLSEKERVTLEIYNGIGKRMQLLLNNEALEAGMYTERLMVNSYPPGIYFVMLRTTNDQITKKLIVQR